MMYRYIKNIKCTVSVCLLVLFAACGGGRQPDKGHIFDESKYKPSKQHLSPDKEVLLEIYKYTGGESWELVKAYDSNKKVIAKYFLYNGKRSGPLVRYYPNGVKMYEGYFKDGKEDSVQILYYPDGKKQTEMFYKDGREAGTWYYYDSLGLNPVKVYKDK